MLLDTSTRILGTSADPPSQAAKSRLEALGVEVRLGQGADQIGDEGVIVAGERIASKTVIWTAGAAPSPAGKWLGAETDRAGRVRIRQDLTVTGQPDLLVVGDTASLDQDGKPLPGVPQVAIQEGRYAGRLIHSRVTGSSAPPPFRYFDKGNMAVVGKGFAILQSGTLRFSGFLAWLARAAVQLEFLSTSSLRVSVFVQWVWTWITGQRGSRPIVHDHAPDSVSSKPLHVRTACLESRSKQSLRCGTRNSVAGTMEAIPGHA